MSDMDQQATDPVADVRGERLFVVMPVYNEQESVSGVIDEWSTCLDQLSVDYTILVLNDGSTDQTLAALQAAAATNAAVRVIDKPNSGHGQTCVRGYQEALAQGADWVFQCDSDGQCDPVYFAGVWARRTDHPAVYGQRVTRDDGAARRFISQVCRVAVRLASGVDVPDSNVPYRLIRADVLGEVVQGFPGDFGLANILVSVILQKALGRRLAYVPIGFRDRSGGTASVKWSGFARHGRRLFAQLREQRGFVDDRCRAIAAVVDGGAAS